MTRPADHRVILDPGVYEPQITFQTRRPLTDPARFGPPDAGPAKAHVRAHRADRIRRPMPDPPPGTPGSVLDPTPLRLAVELSAALLVLVAVVWIAWALAA